MASKTKNAIADLRTNREELRAIESQFASKEQKLATGLARSALSKDPEYKNLQVLEKSARRTLQVARMRVSKTTSAQRTLQRKLDECNKVLAEQIADASKSEQEHTRLLNLIESMETQKAQQLVAAVEAD